MFFPFQCPRPTVFFSILYILDKMEQRLLGLTDLVEQDIHTKRGVVTLSRKNISLSSFSLCFLKDIALTE